MLRRSWSFSRLSAFAVVMLALAPPALAQQAPVTSPPADPILSSPAFAQSLKGRRLLLTTTDGRRFDGRVESTSNGLRTDNSAVVPLSEVARVERVTHRIQKGLGIGLLLGLGIGALTYVQSCEDDCNPGAILLMSGFGAGIGAGFGALGNATNRRSDVLFDSKTRKGTTTVAVAPILSPTRKGVAFSMTWR